MWKKFPDGNYYEGTVQKVTDSGSYVVQYSIAKLERQKKGSPIVKCEEITPLEEWNNLWSSADKPKPKRKPLVKGDRVRAVPTIFDDKPPLFSKQCPQWCHGVVISTKKPLALVRWDDQTEDDVRHLDLDFVRAAVLQPATNGKKGDQTGADKNVLGNCTKSKEPKVATKTKTGIDKNLYKAHTDRKRRQTLGPDRPRRDGTRTRPKTTSNTLTLISSVQQCYSPPQTGRRGIKPAPTKTFLRNVRNRRSRRWQQNQKPASTNTFIRHIYKQSRRATTHLSRKAPFGTKEK